jgi:tetratricopeptide (TPR) repeat protein
LALFGVTSAVYWSGIDNPFVYDDVLIVQQNLYLKDSAHLTRFFKGEISSKGAFRGHHRPLPMLSFHLNHRLGGGEPRGYRAVNLGLHLLCGLLVYFTVRRLLRSFARARAPRATSIALVAAALFLLHPLNSAAFLLVWKRTTLLAALLFLGALYVYLRLRGFGDPPPESRARRVGLSVAAVLLFFLAMASKETAITLPVVLLVLEMWPRDGRRELSFEGIMAHAAMWIIVALQLTVFFPHDIAENAAATPWPYLLAQAKVIWLYLTMAVAPWLLAGAYDVAVPAGLLDSPWVVLGGLGIVGALAAAVVWRKRAPLPSLAVLWVLTTLSPTSSFIPGPLLVDEDRTYLPFVLVWALVGLGVVTLWRRGRAARLAAATVTVLAVLGLSAATVARCVTWSDPVWMWVDTLRRYPGAVRARTNLCVRLSTDPRRARDAITTCGRVHEEIPGNNLAAEGLARALMVVGKRQAAASVLERALEAAPGAANLQRMAGLMAWTEDHPRAAVQHFLKALRADPWDVGTKVFLAKSYQELGRMREARVLVASLGDAVVDDFDARLALGELLLEIGDLDRARRIMEELRASQPRQVEPIVTLSLVADRGGDRDEALRLLETAERIAGADPGSLLRIASAQLDLAPEKAARNLERVLKRKSNVQVVRLMLAFAHLRRGATLEACAAHRRVESVDRESPAQVRWSRALRSACRSVLP